MNQVSSSPSNDFTVVILGAGPAGLGAAYQLAHRTRAKVVLLEQDNQVGGNAASFELANFRVDLGSHRLHPSCDPQVLRDIRNMLGEDLLDRPRNGRINLRGHWIHFPLQPADLAFRLPPDFSLGVARDIAHKLFIPNHEPDDSISFATVMEKGLGRTICKDFYFPYARKIWGEDPHELSAMQAHRRVSNYSFTKMLQTVLVSIPGLKPAGKGHYYYPRLGFGQICEAYARKAQSAGVELCLNTIIKSIMKVQTSASDGLYTIKYIRDDQEQSLLANHVWSTIPITTFTQLLSPGPAPELVRSCLNLEYRCMILIYLVLEQHHFSRFDAHYFPGPGINITRLSEPKNYSNDQGPDNFTVLCAELPCSTNDDVWVQSDDQLAMLVYEDLRKANIPINAPISKIVTRRIRYAYPIYRIGYDKYLNQLDDWISTNKGLLSFGRQGLFVHDNTHHALYMAYSAVDCLSSDGYFDDARWKDFRKIFNTHVVED
jgi:protoporphyrinogen oxidase